MEKDQSRGRRRVDYRDRENRKIKAHQLADHKACPSLSPYHKSPGQRKLNAKKSMKRRRNVSVPRRIKTGNGRYKGCSYCYPTISQRLIEKKDLQKTCRDGWKLEELDD